MKNKKLARGEHDKGIKEAMRRYGERFMEIRCSP